MAGPYYSQIISTDGRVINAYHAANQAVGTLLPTEINGGVASTSEKSFTIREPFTIDDIMTTVVDAATPHQVEIVKNDVPTGKYIVFNAAKASTNTARKTQRLTLTAGVYKLLTRVVGPA